MELRDEEVPVHAVSCAAAAVEEIILHRADKYYYGQRSGEGHEDQVPIGEYQVQYGQIG